MPYQCCLWSRAADQYRCDLTNTLSVGAGSMPPFDGVLRN
ncbi:hypothetical protein MMCCUG48898_1914 [Mycobacteroides abscessus subsp. massiliense CCUG 48898 = JCM 15300]|nr:hypothetical protein MMCCUG48898_5141 [Mycobacteroides abscessus subsp. massiliense CCUG 48898 = JCM 15300]EIV68567.1 hypothetical protein MMCCUG48898_1914 [Mycobacteroides abscessus subsp. massiliense CCUG 48898 = JCM 15300]